MLLPILRSLLLTALTAVFVAGCDRPAKTPEAPHTAVDSPAERPAISSPAVAPPRDTIVEVRPDLKKYFDEFNVSAGAFVLYDINANRYVRYNPERCAEGFLPASTFKIFNSLVALETGAVRDEHEVIPWDGVTRWVKEWNEDQAMTQAFQRSTVWFYQELARRIGETRMRSYIEREKYGNMDIGGGIDQFWLDGALRISADQQVGMLRKLYAGKLGFSERSMRVVRELMVIERNDRYTLRGKTGWTKGKFGNLGWLVGYVERGSNVYIYAMNLSTTDPDFPMMQARRAIAGKILAELGALPTAGE